MKLKSTIKSWAVVNLMELSTWIGVVMFFREFFAYNGSVIMMLLSLVLVFVSDAKLNGWVQKHTPGLRKWIESL